MRLTSRIASEGPHHARRRAAPVQRLLEAESDPIVQLVQQGGRSQIALVGPNSCAPDVSCFGLVEPIVQVQLPPGVPPLVTGVKDAPQRETDIHKPSLAPHPPFVRYDR